MTPETSLKKAIKDYLRLKKLFWWYNLAGLGAYPGVPDIFVLKDGTLYGIEVKAAKGRVSEKQTAFNCGLRNNGARAIVARSLDDVMEVL